MQDSVIKIKKPPNRQGGLIDRLRSLLSRLSRWFARAMGKTRDLEGPTTATNQRKQVGSGNGNSVLRIRVRPPGGGDAAVGKTATPSMAGPVLPKAKNGRINLDTDVRTCNACKQELAEGDPKARCSRNPQHIIHSRCVKIMKFKCPYCGGLIAGSSRPAAGGSA